MKIKRLILVSLLFKIICLTLKSDSCKNDEPIIIEEKITNNVQIRFYYNGPSISMYDVDCVYGGDRDGFQYTKNQKIDS